MLTRSAPGAVCVLDVTARVEADRRSRTGDGRVYQQNTWSAHPTYRVGAREIGVRGRVASAPTRHRLFTRDRYHCRECGRAGRLEAHHVTPLWRDPEQHPYAVAELVTLCRGCHTELGGHRGGPGATRGTTDPDHR